MTKRRLGGGARRRRAARRPRAQAARQTLLLVGGAGRMGRRLAPHFRAKGFRVVVADPAGVPAGFGRGSLDDAATADVVCVAASLEAAPAA